MRKIGSPVSACLLVATALSLPQVGWACGVRCVCNVPNSKIVLCQNTDCDSNVTTYYQGTAWTSCFVWQSLQVQCCGINENSEAPGPLCGGTATRTKGSWSDKLSRKSLSPDSAKVNSQ